MQGPEGVFVIEYTICASLTSMNSLRVQQVAMHTCKSAPPNRQFCNMESLAVSAPGVGISRVAWTTTISGV